MNAEKKSGPNSCKSPSRRLTSNYTTAKVSPRQSASQSVNGKRLTALGVAFEDRPKTKDVVCRCFCGSRCIVDYERPFIYCLAGASQSCPANRMSFEAVMVRLR
jgi:hypothetical protein